MKAIILKTNELVDIFHVREVTATCEILKYYTARDKPNKRYTNSDLYIIDFGCWKEITEDNCDIIYQIDEHEFPIMIANRLSDEHITYHDLHNVSIGIGTMAKYGGYYYNVLHKLK